jgi:hypothetical protein
MGFSFADEHIRELTLRVANTNLSSSLIKNFCISFTNFKSLSNSIFLPSARQETEPCNLMILNTGISEVFS